MRKILSVSLVLALAIGLATTVILYAHNPGYYGDLDVKTDVKNIDKGIQVTITSEDPQIAKNIQENAGWFRDFFRYGHRGPHRYSRWRYGEHHGCGAWPW